MTSYYPYSEILSNIFDLSRFISQYSNQNKKIREFIGKWLKVNLKDWESYAPLLNEILPLDWEENLITDNFRGGERADKLIELLLNILSFDEKKKLFLLDNAQWFDYNSWILTLDIAKNIKNSIILVALRPFDSVENVSYLKLRKRKYSETMELKGLDTENIIKLLKSKLKKDELPQYIIDESISIIQSNPLIALEIVEQIKSSGVLDTPNSVRRNSSLNSLLTSTTISKTVALSSLRAVFTAKLDKLSPKQRGIVNVASIIGSTFNVMLLLDVTNRFKTEENKPQQEETKLQLENLFEPSINIILSEDDPIKESNQIKIVTEDEENPKKKKRGSKNRSKSQMEVEESHNSPRIKKKHKSEDIINENEEYLETVEIETKQRSKSNVGIEHILSPRRKRSKNNTSENQEGIEPDKTHSPRKKRNKINESKDNVDESYVRSSKKKKNVEESEKKFSSNPDSDDENKVEQNEEHRKEKR